MENFTPVSATAGGVLIGIAAVILMGLNGRIAGVSGIFSGIVFGGQGDRLWRALFVVGLVVGPVITTAVTGEAPGFEVTSNWALIVIGGILVGFGTRLGSGCTSGHGICGLARLSRRSIVAVGLFMAAGFATVTILRTLFGA